MEDNYQLLGVPPNASQEEIRERFRFLAQAYHPDRFTSPSYKKEAEETFKKINNAYQILSDPSRRAQYDKQRSASDTRYAEERRRGEEATAWRRAHEEAEAAQQENTGGKAPSQPDTGNQPRSILMAILLSSFSMFFILLGFVFFIFAFFNGIKGNIRGLLFMAAIGIVFTLYGFRTIKRG